MTDDRPPTPGEQPPPSPADDTPPTDPVEPPQSDPTAGPDWGPPPTEPTSPADGPAAEPGSGSTTGASPGTGVPPGDPGFAPGFTSGGPGFTSGGTGFPPGGPGPQASPNWGHAPIAAFAWRHGLVRPAKGSGRVLAGVCGAFGRATNTDPVLWRVILVVLSIFGGIGVLVYLLGWLLLPADGDTATPVEAVLGRGHSSTGGALTVIAAVIVLVSLGVGFSTRFSPGLAGVALVAIVAILLLRDRRTGPAPTQPPPVPSASPGAAWSSAQSWSTTQTLPTDPPPGATAPNPSAFAPYGPFSSAPPPPPRLTEPPPPRPRRPRSALGRLTFFVAVVAVGLIVLLDVSGVSVPFAVYPATALAIVGLGLLIGSWIGRGRGLIALGILLSIMLGVFGTVSVGPQVHGGMVIWRPASLSQVDSTYDAAFGDATLDLSQVDFSTAPAPVDIHVSVNAGSLQIILPPTVDTTVTSRVKFEAAEVFKDSQSGVQSEPNTVTDLGTDGRGGGQLNLTTEVSFGSLEVRR